MPKFEPGNNRNPAGRPKGSKDKKQFSLTYWFKLIEADYNKLSPSQRTRIALECWKKLIDKSKSLPTTSEDSKLNANESMKLLRDVEQGSPSVETPPASPIAIPEKE